MRTKTVKTAPANVQTTPLTAPDDDEMLPEYDFSGGERGRYAGKITSRSRSVTLAPDVAAVFADSEAVNNALRALMAAARATVPTVPASADKAA